MKIDQFKSQYLSAKAQVVLMDNQCHLVETCHTLFHIPEQKQVALSDIFPLLESIPLLLPQTSKEELSFPRVEFTANGYNYISDFIFFRNPQNTEQIIWIIQDLTQQYQHFTEIQKERNELNIKNRRLEFQQEINAMQVELRYRQKVHQLQVEHMIALSPLSENEKFDFTNTIWTLLHAIAQPEYKDIPLKLHIDKKIPPVLWGNQQNLCQILHNIITTVLRNTRQNELHLFIEKRSDKENEISLQFSITNTDVALPNYSGYIKSKETHVSAKPHLHANYMPLFIAQNLIHNNGGNFETTLYDDNKQIYSYTFLLKFDNPTT